MENTYLFKVDWVNDYVDTDEPSYGTIGAETFEEAVHHIEKRFPIVYKIEIRSLSANDGFTFLTKEEYEKQIKDDEEC